MIETTKESSQIVIILGPNGAEKNTIVQRVKE